MARSIGMFASPILKNGRGRGMKVSARDNNRESAVRLIILVRIAVNLVFLIDDGDEHVVG